LACTNYTVLIIKSLDDATSSKTENNSTGTRQQLENIILEKFSTFVSPLLFQDLDGDHVLILSDLTDTQYELICNKILPSCIRNIKSYLNINIFIAIGSIEERYDQVFQSYLSAKKLLEYRLVMPLKVIVTHKDTNNKAIENQRFLQFNYAQLKNLILLKDQEKIVGWIDDVFLKIYAMPYLEPLVVQNLVLEILFFTISTIKSIDSDIDILHDFPDLYMNVLKLESISDFNTWLKDTVTKFMNILIYNNKSNSTLINTISIYIQENYTKNINLDTVASEFDKNPAYLGQLFKKEFGESFTNYINKIRIEKAKELLLKNPSLTMTEVSFAVGYFNTNYFYTIFKKLTGTTPSDFKLNNPSF
jgi:two-component system, response regulator YesN